VTHNTVPMVRNAVRAKTHFTNCETLDVTRPQLWMNATEWPSTLTQTIHKKQTSSARNDSVAQTVQYNGNSEISRLHLMYSLNTVPLQNPQEKHLSC